MELEEDRIEELGEDEIWRTFIICSREKRKVNWDPFHTVIKGMEMGRGLSLLSTWRDSEKPHPKRPFTHIFLEWTVLVGYSVRYFGDTKPHDTVLIQDIIDWYQIHCLNCH